MTLALLVAILFASYHPPTVILGSLADTGMGKCKMDQHYHNSDQLCHRDSDDSAIHVLRR